MTNEPLPEDSKLYAQEAFKAKVTWHDRNAQMSFVQKLAALDRMRERTKVLRSLKVVPK
jgi:hypothetical protein